jgi:hypothetical protein
MKGLLCFALAGWLCMFSFAMAEDEGAFSFRNGITLGMSQDEVIACEGAEPDIKEGMDFYYADQTAAGREAVLIYSFSARGGLNGIYVTFPQEHEDPENYLADYDDINAALLNKYKKPSMPACYVWSDASYEDDHEPYGQAISNGHMDVLSAWEFDDVVIAHSLTSVSTEIRHFICYINPERLGEIDTDGI